MTFFNIKLSKDTNRLSFSMNPILRGLLLFFLFSVIGMFIFTYSINDFLTASIPGKISIIVIPLLVLLAGIYEFSIEFDKKRKKIILKKGTIFLHKSEEYDFSSFTGIHSQKIKTNAPKTLNTNITEDGSSLFKHKYFEERCSFGFYINGKLILLDRALKLSIVKSYINAFKAFFPDNFKIY